MTVNGTKPPMHSRHVRCCGKNDNTGYYTFTYVKDGETKIFPARYSFTYVKNGENWLIVDHHSSAMPQAPK